MRCAVACNWTSSQSGARKGGGACGESRRSQQRADGAKRTGPGQTASRSSRDGKDAGAGCCDARSSRDGDVAGRSNRGAGGERSNWKRARARASTGNWECQNQLWAHRDCSGRSGRAKGAALHGARQDGATLALARAECLHWRGSDGGNERCGAAGSSDVGEGIARRGCEFVWVQWDKRACSGEDREFGASGNGRWGGADTVPGAGEWQDGRCNAQSRAGVGRMDGGSTGQCACVWSCKLQGAGVAKARDASLSKHEKRGGAETAKGPRECGRCRRRSRNLSGSGVLVAREERKNGNCVAGLHV